MLRCHTTISIYIVRKSACFHIECIVSNFNKRILKSDISMSNCIPEMINKRQKFCILFYCHKEKLAIQIGYLLQLLFILFRISS